MANMLAFDKGIENMIKKLSYPLYLIQQDKTVECPCLDFTTKQPYQFCKKCLGTGYKIRIKNIKGVRQSSEKITVRGEGVGIGETGTKNMYYILGDTHIYKDNIFVDDQEADVVQRAIKKRSDHSFQLYYKCETAYLKSNKPVFLKNFYEIVGNK